MDPQNFYTWPSLGALTIAAGAVIVVANTVRTLLKLDSPWVAFVASAGIVFFGAFTSARLIGVPDYAIAFLNSCLLFCTATGANQALVAAKPQPEGKPRPYGRRPVKWLSPWIRTTDAS